MKKLGKRQALTLFLAMLMFTACSDALPTGVEGMVKQLTYNESDFSCIVEVEGAGLQNGDKVVAWVGGEPHETIRKGMQPETEISFVADVGSSQGEECPIPEGVEIKRMVGEILKEMSLECSYVPSGPRKEGDAQYFECSR